MRVRASRFVPPAAAVAKPAPAPERVSVLTKLQRLRRELRVWAKAGAPMAPREIRQQRAAICAACTYWHATGNLGLGECRYPGCGCTRAKVALATSRCPAVPPKWGAMQDAKRAAAAPRPNR
jgi:hypothetical protein